MKPVQLTLCGWGPYPGREVIDFRPFYEKGIFLITGPTGSGKTSIFDGIAYCLYGETSGRARDRYTLRSDFAQPGAETFSELIFSQGGKEYKVRRSPRYNRPKKRGEGTVLSAEKAQLTMPDGSVREGVSEVNETVRELLGLEYVQFKQIVMIAQGEFMEVLRAGSKERADILRSLFGTGLYGAIQAKLTERAGLLRQELEQVRRRLEEQLTLIRPGERQSLKDALEEKRSMEEILTALTDSLKEDRRNYRAMEQEESGLEKEIRENVRREQQLLEAGKALEKSRADEAEACRSLETVRREQENLKREEAALPEAGRLLEEQRAQRIRLQSLRERIRLAEQKSGQLKERERQAAEAAAELTDRQAQLPLLEKKREEALQAGEGLLRGREELEQLSRRREEQEKKEQLLCTFSEMTKSLEGAEKILRQKQEEYRNADKARTEAEQNSREAARRFRDSIIGLAAREVREGEPCPVCGSLEHPCVAPLDDSIPDEHLLQQLEENCRKKNLEYEKAYKAALEARKEADGLRLKLTEQEQQLQECGCRAEEAGKELEQCRLVKKQTEKEYSALQKSTALLEKKAAGQERCLEELMAARMAEAACREKTGQLKEQADAARLELAGEEQRLLEELEAAGWRAEYVQVRQNSKKIIPPLKQFDQEIDRRIRQEEEERGRQEQLKAQAQKAADRVLTAETLFARCRSERENREKSFREWEEICRNQTPSRELEEKRKKLRSGREALGRENALHEKAAAGMRTCLEQQTSLEKEYSLVKDLEKTAKGENPERIVLEQYVLASYYREVLRAANLRLSRMSQGRYELLLVDRVQDARTKDSLGLEVLDYYTGRRRPVNTLSGGETFQGALALSLGLSDVVQSNAGGVRAETLFIDEGFGALDSQSLRQAMDTIVRSAGGDKLIGIISHVEELKDQIPDQIRIRQGLQGSTLWS